MRHLILLIFILSIFACKNSNIEPAQIESNQVITDLPEWAIDATIYEVNMRQFTKEGTFESFSSHLPRIKEMGIDIIWLMPINPISEKNKKGSLGSPYAVADYKGINPEYGKVEDFDKMVNKIHELGMKIIIDWVPNHTGWDNKWITAHPEWYTKNDKGEIIDPIDYNTGKSWGWTDVADLNYDNKEMRAEMISTLKFWIKERNIDGFRMDVAHGVPDDFWMDCNAQLKAEGDIFLLAEGEVPKQRNLGGFHADYGWTLHHIMNKIAQGEANVDSIWSYVKTDQEKFNKGFHMNFTSNHDENTWSGTEFERMGEAHKAMAVLAATFEGMPLVYGGQEEPLKRRLEFFEKDDIGFKDYAYKDFYTQLLKLKKEYPALRNGEFGSKAERLLEDKDVLAFKREKDGKMLIICINLTSKKKSFILDFDLGSGSMILKSDENMVIKENQITLEPWGYIIYSN